MHYARWNRHGSTDYNPNWHGLKTGIPYLNLRGYMEFFSKEHGKKIRLHRFVMEKHLGRRLTADEKVHHINHNKLDNRIENLKLTAQKDHALYHSKERWSNYKNSKEYKKLISNIEETFNKFKNYKNSSSNKHINIFCFCKRKANVFGMCRTHYSYAWKKGIVKKSKTT